MSTRSGYDLSTVQKKTLKFKSDNGKIHKKKKKKKKKEVYGDVKLSSNKSTEEELSNSQSSKSDSMTPAERKFKETQEKHKMERILKRASTTHRDRVEEFNRNLDALSEHYDIPKVSWTK